MHPKLAAEVQKYTWWAGMPLVIASRWAILGVPVTSADIDFITLTVTEVGQSEPLAGFDGLVFDDLDGIVFDELQTPPGWDKDVDKKGFNVKFTIPGDALPLAGRTYRAVLCGMKSDPALTVLDVWEITTKAI